MSNVESTQAGDNSNEKTNLSFRCNICGSQSISKITKRIDDIEVCFCQTCGMGSIFPIPDDLSIFYEDGYYSGTLDKSEGYSDYEEMAEHGVSWAAAMVQSFTKSGMALDIGCANGYLLRKLGPQFSCHGIEMNKEAADKATEYGVEIIGNDLFDPSIQRSYAESFDVITSIATFEHLRDFRGGVLASMKLLKRDGVLIFEVPLISTKHDNSTWFSSSLEHVYYPTISGINHLFSNVLKLPALGKEIYIDRYASTYIGVVTWDEQTLARVRPIWEEIVSSKSTSITP